MIAIAASEQRFSIIKRKKDEDSGPSAYPRDVYPGDGDSLEAHILGGAHVVARRARLRARPVARHHATHFFRTLAVRRARSLPAISAHHVLSRIYIIWISTVFSDQWCKDETTVSSKKLGRLVYGLVDK